MSRHESTFPFGSFHENHPSRRSRPCSARLLWRLRAGRAAPKSDWTITGNAGVFSDYRFRGIIADRLKPAFQGGFDIAHASGFYVGNWNSNVDRDFYDGASLEMDFYGGYKRALGDFGLDVGVLYYYYPNSGAGGATSIDNPRSTSARAGRAGGRSTPTPSPSTSAGSPPATSTSTRPLGLRRTVGRLRPRRRLRLPPHIRPPADAQRPRALRPTNGPIYTDASRRRYQLGVPRTSAA